MKMAERLFYRSPGRDELAQDAIDARGDRDTGRRACNGLRNANSALR